MQGFCKLLLSLQCLKHYGDSVRLGHKTILQSLPRLLTLYFEFGTKYAATKSPSQKLATAQKEVGQLHIAAFGSASGSLRDQLW
jgi:hypothetical protein